MKFSRKTQNANSSTRTKQTVTTDRIKIMLSIGVFAIVVFSLSQFILQYYLTLDQQKHQRMLLNHVSSYAQHVQISISDSLAALNTLQTMLIMENYQVERFNYWGKAVLEANKTISVVQLAPKGIVRYIIPLKGNEKALGHDLLADKQRDDGARRTIKTKSTTFVGPLKLIQNGRLAVIARKPVFQKVAGKDTFWGFVIALIHLEDLIYKKLEWQIDSDFEWRIVGMNPDQDTTAEIPLIAQSDHAEKVSQWTVSYNINVPNGTWQMQMAHINDGITAWSANVVIVILTALFSFLFGFQQVRYARKNKDILMHGKQIKEERKQFLSLLDSIPESIYVSDMETNEILFANKKIKELIGRDPVGEKCYVAIQHKAEVCEFCTSKYIKNTDKPYFWESHNPVFQKDFYILDRKIQWTNEQSARFELAIDITERKRTENKIKENEELLKIAFENANIGIMYVDRDARILYANKESSNIFGYTYDELTAKTVNEIAVPEDKTVSSKFIRSALHDQSKDSTVFEKNYFHKNGSIITCQVSSTLLYDSQGHPLYFISHVKDITKQKQAEQDLIKGEAKYRLITENASDVIWILNLTKERFTYISPSVLALRGYTPEEAMQQDMNQSLTPESAKLVMESIGEIVPLFLADPETMTKQTYRHELRQPCKDGSVIWVETTTRYRLNENHEVEVLGISRNIEERKKLEQQLEEEAKKLQELVATKDRFISILGHDLKNPFNALIGFSSMLLSDIDQYDKTEIKNFIDIIHTSVKETYNLLNNLLEWSRSQQNKIPFNPESTNLYYIIQETYLVLQSTAEAKQIQIQRHVPENIILEVDIEMIKTVIRNLVGNAIKYTPEKGTIDIVAKESSDSVQIEIIDTGTGMSEKTKNTLFKLGETMSVPGTDGETGTGFGLLLCKEFIDKHKGKIVIESELGKGSRFVITLPVSHQT